MQVWCEPENPCLYVPDQNWSHLFFFSDGHRMSEDVFEEFMDTGWRHFSARFYRVHCTDCTRCRVIWIDPFEYQPNRSQKRALKDNQDLEVRITRPVFDQEHLDLINRFQAQRSDARGWMPQVWDEASYMQAFAPIGNFSLEMQVRDAQKRLVAVTLLDATHHVQNHIYAYHDPDLLHRSLGTFMVIWGMEWAKKSSRERVYLGTWTADCPSLQYKGNFRPYHELDWTGPEGPLEDQGFPLADPEAGIEVVDFATWAQWSERENQL
jgi:arginyl-tRNA--protein-N-Asp/Glu arginylyltransferase